MKDSKLKVRFGLVAVKKFDGSFMVREWFETPKLEGTPGRPASQSADFIDDGIKGSHPIAYKAFHDYVEANAERLYPKAIEIYPEVLFDLIPEKVSAPAEPEVLGDEE